ncbi:MAG: site-specific integrase [Hoeflea sp.]|nr:site-specific integrase [Rhodobiaceae bacterium]MCC0037134.1 site-specific integrase [Hoeflea sp.]
MNEMIRTPVADEEVFAAFRPKSLGNIRRECEAELDGTALRDTRSAFRFVEQKLDVNLDEVPGTAPAVRALLGRMTPALADVSPKRLENIRSLIRKAVERFGSKRIWIAREVTLAPDWEALMGLIEVREHRWALSRLAAYCTLKGLAPTDVCSDTLIGFERALERESLSKDPPNIRKHTIAVWNMCQTRVSGWPDTRLSSPFKGEPYSLPLSTFPAGLSQDLEAWAARMTDIDPFAASGPVRPMRATSVEAYRITVRRLASVLIREHGLSPDEITGVAVILEIENFKNSLRPFLPSAAGYGDGYAYKMAAQMRSLARHLLHLPADHLAQIDAIVERLKPVSGPKMGKRNRDRLQAFDDPAIVQRVLAFPEEELDRALKLRNPLRQAKGVERALVLSLSIFTGLRAKNLRSLRLDMNIRRSGSRVFIELCEDETKTHTILKVELPAETIVLLDLFVDTYRAHIPGALGNPHLFAAPDGVSPRSYSAIREMISEPLRKHLGLEVSPHLFRHIMAKIVAERAPEELMNVSRVLGHKSVNTTYQSYLGTETPAASRRVHDLLKKARNAGDEEPEQKKSSPIGRADLAPSVPSGSKRMVKP